MEITSLSQIKFLINFYFRYVAMILVYSISIFSLSSLKGEYAIVFKNAATCVL